MACVKPEEIVENMLQAGAKKAGLPVKQLLIRGFLAGAFLGYATTLAILAATQTGWGIAGALVFPVGFVMIVLLGLELATGNFALIPIAIKTKRTSLGRLLVNWTWVLTGNLIGSVTYAYLYCIVATKMGAIDPETIPALERTITIAETKTLEYAKLGFDGDTGCRNGFHVQHHRRKNRCNVAADHDLFRSRLRTCHCQHVRNSRWHVARRGYHHRGLVVMEWIAGDFG